LVRQVPSGLTSISALPSPALGESSAPAALKVVKAIRELEGEDYVKRLHCEFPAALARLGIAKPYHAVNVRYVGEREDWIQSLVQAGLGCAVMPEHLPLLPGLEMRPLVEPEVFREISLATVAGRPHSRPVAAAVSAAQRFSWPDGSSGTTT